MTTKDGFKFDVGFYLLVANLNPFVAFSGADVARVCTERLNATDPAPFPGMSSTFNPFQHVCNNAISMQHPKYDGDGSGSRLAQVKTLSKVLDDPNQVERLYQKLDEATLAAVEVVRQRWQAKVGMFHMFRLDFIIDPQEKVYVLEMNKAPDISTHTNPTVLSDMMRLVWTVNDALRNGQSSEILKRDLETFVHETPFHILHLDDFDSFSMDAEKAKEKASRVA
ncbi:MAG: hypothetical protein SGILL_009304 [Bacillariaceae sp.]